MKKLFALLALSLTGCSSVPYSIEMINVGDNVEYVYNKSEEARQLVGCNMKVDNILTKEIDRSGKPFKLFDGGILCGQLTCDKNAAKTTEYACYGFEAFRLERPSQSDRVIQDRGGKYR